MFCKNFSGSKACHAHGFISNRTIPNAVFPKITFYTTQIFIECSEATAWCIIRLEISVTRVVSVSLFLVKFKGQNNSRFDLNEKCGINSPKIKSHSHQHERLHFSVSKTVPFHPCRICADFIVILQVKSDLWVVRICIEWLSRI